MYFLNPILISLAQLYISVADFIAVPGRLLRRCGSCTTVSCWTSTVLSAARKSICSMTWRLDYETSKPIGREHTHTHIWIHTAHEGRSINTEAEWDQQRWLGREDNSHSNNAHIHISLPHKSLFHSWQQMLHPHQGVSLSCCYSNRIASWWGGWLQVCVCAAIKTTWQMNCYY